MAELAESPTTQDLVDRARSAPTTSVAVRELAAEMAGIDDVPGLLDQAAAHADADTATRLMLAAATAGTPPTCEQVARVLPHVAEPPVFTVLVGATVGDRVTMLLDLVESGHMSVYRNAIALFLCTELLDDDPPPPRLLTQMRLVGRRGRDPISTLLLGVAAVRLGDENTLRVLTDSSPFHDPEFAEELAEKMRQSLAGPPVDVLPGRPPLKRVSGFTVRRPTEKVSRNAPCPCGSGKKYKKCCLKADEARLSDPSPVAGLTMREYVAQAGRHMSIDDFIKLGPQQILDLDFESLPSLHLLAAARTLSAFAFWDGAERAMDLLEGRSDLPCAIDEYREELISDALDAGADEVALRQAAKLEDPDGLDPSFRLGLELIADGSDILAKIEASAAESLAEDTADHIVVPYALMRRYPALGLLTARGCLNPIRDLDSVTLLEDIEEARDRLQLPPGDPFGDHYDLLAGHHFDALDAEAETEALTAKNQALAAELNDLRERLNSASGRSREVERSLHDATERLAAAESAAARAPVAGKATAANTQATAAAAQAADPVALRRKVEDLKQLVRDGIEERRDLRRQLTGARERIQEERPKPDGAQKSAAATADDELEADLDAPVRTEVLIPIFEERARAAIRDAPPNVGGAAVKVAGGLAAGTEHAWHGVKQLRSVRGIYSARVGIHHRLLFEVDSDGGGLRVLEFIARRDLEGCVGRYR